VITTVAALGSVFSPSAATAATYYVAVDDNGSDSNSGTSGSPFRTIGKGISVLNAGDTLLIRSGTYDERPVDSNNQRIGHGNSWSDAPIIKPDTGATVTFRPSCCGGINLAASGDPNIQYLIIDGDNGKGPFNFIIDGVNVSQYSSVGVSINQLSHIRITNIEIKNFTRDYGTGLSVGGADNNEIINVKIHDIATNPTQCPHSPCASGDLSHGIYMSGGSNNLFDRIESYHNGAYGLQLYNSGGAANNNIVRNSKFYDNGLVVNGGMVIGSGDGNQAYNNLVYNNHGNGIDVCCGGNPVNNRVYNNTVYGNAKDGINVGSGSGRAVVNNISFGNGGSQIWIEPRTTNITHANNLCSSAGAGCAIVSSNPSEIFVKPGVDFHLREGSPAIDKGETISIASNDADGVPRRQGGACTIGAYEFGLSRSIPAPTDFRKISN
jgi:hypothetical protein